jgi:ketosteroid isomerase-like protein
MRCRGRSASAPFGAEGIRAAERVVVAALESNDPTAWVCLYTEDAVLLEPVSAPVEGRQALLEMAGTMPP